MAKQAAKATNTAKNTAKKGKGQPGGKPAKSMLARKPADTGRKQEPRANVVQRLVAYLKNVRVELKKVIWPKRPEVVASTIIVLATLLVLAVYVMGLDWVSELLVNLVSGAAGSPALPR